MCDLTGPGTCQPTVNTMTIWVCVDCLFAREGDGTPDRDPSLPVEWNLIDDDPTILPGDVSFGLMTSEHACGIERGEFIEECECAQDDFSSRPCAGCGTHLAGQREAYTLTWRS